MIVTDAKQKMQKSLQKLEDTYKKLRSSGASTAIFDDVKANCYGSMMPLNQIARLSIPEANTIVIQPWDKENLLPIEKAIQQSSLSLNPNNDGKLIRIFVPPLSNERRKELVKEAKSIAEEARVSIRNIRRGLNDSIDTQKKNGEISEDEQKKLQNDIQEQTDTFIAKIGTVLETKEKEILEI